MNYTGTITFHHICIYCIWISAAQPILEPTVTSSRYVDAVETTSAIVTSTKSAEEAARRELVKEMKTIQS